MSSDSAHLEAVPTAPPQPTLFGHPVGLYVLFFTEMWERFSYYGMRGCLSCTWPTISLSPRGRSSKEVRSAAWRSEHSGGLDFHSASARLELRCDCGVRCFANLWLVHRLGLSNSAAGRIFGGPLLGPAQNGLPRRHIDGDLGIFSWRIENWFFFALLLLIIGNGEFKPNISTQVGNLYPPGDPRRDRAFTIFYMGINLGAFICMLVCGTLAASPRFGWHWGFGAAGVGMVFGLIVYSFGQRFLHDR